MALNLSKHDGDLTPGKGDEKKFKLNLEKNELPKVSILQKEESGQKVSENQEITEISNSVLEEKKSRSPLLYILGGLFLVGAVLFFLQFSSKSENDPQNQDISDISLKSNSTNEDTVVNLKGSVSPTSDTANEIQQSEALVNEKNQNESEQSNATSPSSSTVASGNSNGNSVQAQSVTSKSPSNASKQANSSSNKQAVNNSAVSKVSTPNASSSNVNSSDTKKSAISSNDVPKKPFDKKQSGSAGNGNVQKSNNTSSPNVGTASSSTGVSRKINAVSFESNSIANFDAGSPAIGSLNADLVKSLLSYLSENSSNKLTVLGYASSDGDEQKNQILSDDRAERVKKLLVSRGANPEKVATKGMGIVNPIADNATMEGRRKNRRVEFIKE
jgi:outer membrane protein OmpA-like peptidoglycan-associated protein